MSTPLTVAALSSQTIDQSESLNPVILGAGATLIVQRDAGTPAGDAVNVTLSGLSAVAGSQVTVQNGATVSLDALTSVLAASSLNIGSGGTLSLLPTIGASVASPINFTGPNATLVLTQSATSLPVLSSVAGFSASDTIDFRGVPTATAATYANNVVTLYNGTTVVATLAASGVASGTTLKVQSDGNGGVNVGDNLGTVAQRLSGNSSNYQIAAQSSSQDVIYDGVPGRDGTSLPVTGTTIGFSNGIGFIDPQGVAGQVARLYQSLLGRQADVGGLALFTNLVTNQGVSIANVALGIVGSAEFAAKYGNVSDAGFINQLYANVGANTDANATSLLGALSSGIDRGTVATTFANEFPAIKATMSYAGSSSEGEVYRLYRTLLGRAPDQGGLQGFTNQYVGGASGTTIASEMLGSPEYASDIAGLSNMSIVNRLYQNEFGRNADPSGLNYWTSQLNSGGSAVGVALGIANSVEARLDTASATHDGWVFLGSAT